MICSCCGFEISGVEHPIENGKKQVCDNCWNNPSFFFAEKSNSDKRLKVLSELSIKNKEAYMQIQAIRLSQKNVDLYIGKLKSIEILQLYEVDRFKEEVLEGYQRQQYEERTSELIEYLTKCQIAVMPSLFVSLRNARFVSIEGDVGKLEIPRCKGSIWIIDGQHRIGGFEKIYERFLYPKKTDTISTEEFSELMDYELPIVFIDTERVVYKQDDLAKTVSDYEPSSTDLERAIFFIVNKTQRGLSSSLKDALLYKLTLGGIEGIPALRKEKWRIQAAHIGISLSRENDSPLLGLINIGGQSGSKKPIQFNSFVSSLESVINNSIFQGLSNDERVKYFKLYWSAVKKTIPQAFGAEWKEYMLLKAIGIYCLNWLALDVFNACYKNNWSYNEEEIITKLVKPIEGFDWKRETSPLSALGGQKGAQKGFSQLKNLMPF